MKRIILSLLVLAAVSMMAQPVVQTKEEPTKRKKVAVVLCGGGAMGTIHIGALKVLEEAGMPIDMVTGTSMGSIIGGMYAVGYNATDIESIVNSMDWGDILRDRLSMRNQTLDEREKQNIYLFDYRIFLDKSQDTLAGGFIRGINVEKTLRHYLRQPEDIDFKSLPRPFGCIATDLVTDSEVVLDHGSLARSIRASMAVPGVFAPVRMDPYILVDGGTKNNFPADLARKMGADIVIGVRTDLGLNKNYYSTSDILERSVGADIHNRSDENDKYCDFIIRVPVRGYSAAHFYNSAIKELIKRGEEATRAQMDSIMILKQMAGVPTDYKPDYSIISLSDIDNTTANKLVNEENAKNSIKASVGVRYDNEELVAAQIGATYYFGNKLDKTLDLTLRLGKRTMGRLAWNIIPKPHRRFGLSYEIWHEDLDLYMGKRRSENLKFVYQKANATLLSFDALNLNVDLGIAWEHYHHYDILSSQYSIDYFRDFEYYFKDFEHYFNYHASAHYNTEDNWYFTHKGMRAEAQYAYYTDNFAQWKGHAGFSEVSARWRMTVPLASTTHVQPMVYGRLLFGKDVPATAMNMLGGNRDGIYYAQQLSFSGFGRCHLIDSKLLVMGIKLQQRLFKEHYIMAKGHAAMHDDKLDGIFKNKPIWGAQLAYAYNSIVGPLGGSLGWSSLTKQVYIYINLGFEL
ncbi:MAG: patatin-like phospholipase family protein [Muribaculaceae bacterium]|nr:patatin-like phospholipase family protein [Muribaculaceae bacterium]